MSPISAATARWSRRWNAPINRFSWMVRVITMRRPSGTRMRPSRTRALVGQRVMSRPPKRTAPPHGLVSPNRARNSDDLPAPLAPSTATTSPSASVSETPRTAYTRPYRTSSSCTANTVTLHRLGHRRAEIDLLHQWIATNVLGAALGDLTPEIEHDHVLAQRTDEMHVVLDDQHGEPTDADFLQLGLQRIG